MVKYAYNKRQNLPLFEALFFQEFWEYENPFSNYYYNWDVHILVFDLASIDKLSL